MHMRGSIAEVEKGVIQWYPIHKSIQKTHVIEDQAMKYVVSSSFVFCLGFAGPLAAQTAQDGFYTNGYAELSYFDVAGSSNTFGYSEATIGFVDPRSGFGAEFGVDALITEDDDEAAIYGAATYQSSFGKLSFGVPRAALDAYFASVPTVGGMLAFKIGQIGAAKRSFLSTRYLFSDGKVPIGLRYDGTFGTTNIGASYHRFDDLDVYNLAANHQFGPTLVMGGLEHVKDTTLSETRYFLGAETKLGQVSAGLLYSGNFDFSDDAAIEAYAKYKPLEQLELAATALNLDTGSGPDTLFGLSADYSFNQGGYVKAGIADDFNTGNSTAYNLALGLRF